MSGERALVEEHPPGVTLRAASSAVRVLRLDRGVAVALARAHPEAAAAFATQAHAKRIARVPAHGRDVQGARREGRRADRQSRSRRARPRRRRHRARGRAHGDRWWIVESGRLVEHTGQGEARREVRFLRAGDVFGEVGALDGSTRLTTVTAASECRLLELDGAGAGRARGAGSGRSPRGSATGLGCTSAASRCGRSTSAAATCPRGSAASTARRRRRRTSASPPAWTSPGKPAAPSRGFRPRRFPFVRQIDFADCGVAALAMICRAFGRKVSLPFIRQIAGTGQEGTSLRGIMRAAEEAGLEGHALKASKDRLDDLQLPAILHWEGNHWIVLYAVEGDRVRVADPGRGLRRLRPRRGRREVERLVRDVPPYAHVRRGSGRAPRSRWAASPSCDRCAASSRSRPGWRSSRRRSSWSRRF